MRIFISAGGTVTAQSVLKALREDHRKPFVAVGDMDHYNATKAFADAFVRLPAASDPSFAMRCLDAVRKYRIELFVPLICGARVFAVAGCTLWVPDPSIVEKLGDKLAFALFLKDIGLIDRSFTTAILHPKNIRWSLSREKGQAQLHRSQPNYPSHERVALQ